MTYKLNVKLSLFFVAAMAAPAFSQTCPQSPTNVSPAIRSKISFDPKIGIYTYEYTLINSSGSALPISLFALLTDLRPLSISSPEHWKGRFVSLPNLEKNIVWSTSALDPNDPNAKLRGYTGPPLKLFYTIKPGKQLGGFSFKSPYPPGPARYFAEGETGIPVSQPIRTDDEPEPDCPGFFDGGRFQTMLGGVTEGPLPAGTIPIAIRLLKSPDEWHLREFNPDKDSGQVSVLLFPNRDFDPSTLILTSVKFGFGEAPVVSSKTLPTFKDHDDERGDWENSRKSTRPDLANEDEKERSRKAPVLLTFNLATVGIRCDLDKALFLEGKTSTGKNIIGSVPVSTKSCKPWRPKPRR